MISNISLRKIKEINSSPPLPEQQIITRCNKLIKVLNNLLLRKLVRITQLALRTHTTLTSRSINIYIYSRLMAPKCKLQVIHVQICRSIYVQK